MTKCWGFFSNSETQRKTSYVEIRGGLKEIKIQSLQVTEPEAAFAQGSTSDHVSPK